MKVTVVIPTRDRPAALHSCLVAVRAQQDVTLDLVVVDDGSANRAAVAEVAEQFGARLVRLEGGGPAAARNAGIAATNADQILMLDDDCVPQPGWAAALLAAAANASRLVVAGTVLQPPAATTWLRASERIARQSEAASGFFRTLNLSCHRELLVQIPFDETFPAAAGEDRDWCVRAARAGATFIRAPAAAVEHRADLSARAFFRQQLRYGRAVHLLRSRGTHVAVERIALVRGIAAGFRERIVVGLAMVAAAVVTTAGYALERRSARSR